MADHDRRSGEESGTPRWVWVVGAVVAVAALLIVVALLVGGGEHGPSRHMSGEGNGASSALDASPTTRPGHVPPPGVHG